MNNLVKALALSLVVVVGCSNSDESVTKPGSQASSGTATANSADDIGAAVKAVAAGEAILMDVREQSEWDEKHLEGAILVPMSAIDSDTAVLESTEGVDKTKTIYTHCAVGMRASIVADSLKEKGYNVKALKFSFDELVENGFNVAK